eukprot:5392177-Karenia_brevis.AAC.1
MQPISDMAGDRPYVSDRAANSSHSVLKASSSDIPSLASDSDICTDGKSGIAALMSGHGFHDVKISDVPVDFMSSRGILEDSDVGQRCKFEGFVVYYDEQPRDASSKKLSTSPKRQRNEASAIDLMLVDGTGPIFFSMIGDHIVSSFLEKMKTTERQTKMISISIARIVEFQKNDWNGKFLTTMRMLQSIPPVANREGTQISLISEPVSPYCAPGPHIPLSKDACIYFYQPFRTQMIAPFRGTFQGTILDLEGVDATQQGNAK